MRYQLYIAGHRNISPEHYERAYNAGAPRPTQVAKPMATFRLHKLVLVWFGWMRSFSALCFNLAVLPYGPQGFEEMGKGRLENNPGKIPP